VFLILKIDLACLFLGMRNLLSNLYIEGFRSICIRMYVYVWIYVCYSWTKFFFMNMELHKVEKIGNPGNHFRLFSSIYCLEVSLKPDLGLIKFLSTILKEILILFEIQNILHKIYNLFDRYWEQFFRKIKLVARNLKHFVSNKEYFDRKIEHFPRNVEHLVENMKSFLFCS